jgi:hypothetical protein
MAFTSDRLTWFSPNLSRFGALQDVTKKGATPSAQRGQLSDLGFDLPSALGFFGESELPELAGFESLDLESFDLESLAFDSLADLSALAPFL